MVDNIGKRREPLPTLSGVYFIQPSESSLNALLSDYKGAKAPYKTAHVFFSARLDPRVLAAFKAQAPPALMGCLRSLKEAGPPRLLPGLGSAACLPICARCLASPGQHRCAHQAYASPRAGQDARPWPVQRPASRAAAAQVNVELLVLDKRSFTTDDELALQVGPGHLSALDCTWHVHRPTCV